MSRAKVSTKGQIVIPAELRRRYGIRPGDEVRVDEGPGGIVVAPLLKDPVKQGRGLLPKRPSLGEALLEERRREVHRDEPVRAR